MGFFSDAFNQVTTLGGALPTFGSLAEGISGKTGADAALAGAEMQVAAGERAVDVLRGDLAPYRESGGFGLSGLQGMLNAPQTLESEVGRFALDPNVLQSPFYKALQDDATRNTMAQAAAAGRGGAGGTQANIARQSLLLGQQFGQQDLQNRMAAQQQRFNQLMGLQQNRFNQFGTLAQLGENAAARSGTGSADLFTQIGNAQAAGGIGAAQSYGQGAQNIAGIATAIGSMFASDRRIKENIRHIGKTNEGHNLYSFNYIGNPKHEIGVMAQEIEEVIPEAVVEFNGIKHVNYGMIN